MSKDYTEKKCCDKCYHDIENGIVFTIFQCEECPCHKAIAQALAEEKARVVEKAGNLRKEITHPQFALYEKGYNQALDDILSALDKPLTDKLIKKGSKR